MNASNAKDYLPLVQALAEGKTIQAKCQVVVDSSGWRDCEGDISFHGLAENYRIKPEPREKWFVQYKGGSESGPYADKDSAECYALHDHDFTIICYREVIE